ncbi:hypothetical protein J6TS7_53480 [Paenibacillus dendritiformis]|nr:hypothetical protein J6TS7_53480 [Paenibacillus dendritiformis]
MGPVCVRRFGVLFDNARSYASSLNRQLDVGILQNLAIQAAAQAYQLRIRRRTNQEPDAIPDTAVTAYSETRGRTETLRIAFDDTQHARVLSESGNTYEVTGHSCTCPDYTYRHRGNGTACRHMQAVQQVRESQSVATPTSPEEIAITSMRAEIDRLQPITPDILREAERGFSQINWVDEEVRENVLDVWRENRVFDGIYMSEDDAAWEQLRAEAEADWNYKYENVLGGTGNTFGVELEVELEGSSVSGEILQALRNEGITDQMNVSYYHGQRARPGMWRVERDGSLENGIEIVSPVLMDRQEDWEKLERVTKILEEHGATITSDCGGHVHIGIGPLDHRTYSWQRLARIGLGYERLFYRMGGADSELYRITGRRGRHRGTEYAAPFYTEARNVSGTDTAVRSRQRISQQGLLRADRYTIFNTTNIDASLNRKPTVEMRYPNGSLSCKQWQAQIQVANAIVHQAAVIRNDSPHHAFTPGLYQSNNQLRLSDMCNDATETRYFRRFLDVLGNHEDRLAATWLFLRGQA